MERRVLFVGLSGAGKTHVYIQSLVHLETQYSNDIIRIAQTAGDVKSGGRIYTVKDLMGLLRNGERMPQTDPPDITEWPYELWAEIRIKTGRPGLSTGQKSVELSLTDLSGEVYGYILEKAPKASAGKLSLKEFKKKIVDYINQRRVGSDINVSNNVEDNIHRLLDVDVVVHVINTERLIDLGTQERTHLISSHEAFVKLIRSFTEKKKPLEQVIVFTHLDRLKVRNYICENLNEKVDLEVDGNYRGLARKLVNYFAKELKGVGIPTKGFVSFAVEDPDSGRLNKCTDEKSGTTIPQYPRREYHALLRKVLGHNISNLKPFRYECPKLSLEVSCSPKAPEPKPSRPLSEDLIELTRNNKQQKPTVE